MYDFHWSNAKYMNPSRETIPLIRPHQCDSEGGRIRGRASAGRLSIRHWRKYLTNDEKKCNSFRQFDESIKSTYFKLSIGNGIYLAKHY